MKNVLCDLPWKDVNKCLFIPDRTFKTNQGNNSIQV